jgi:hypothetical protein
VLIKILTMGAGSEVEGGRRPSGIAEFCLLQNADVEL